MAVSKSVSESHTVIGKGSVVEGHLEINHGIRVDGTFRGQATRPTTLIVSEGGILESEVIDVARAEIHGVVTGDIRASELVLFGATARVRGQVQTPRLIVEEGATFEPMSNDSSKAES